MIELGNTYQRRDTDRIKQHSMHDIIGGRSSKFKPMGKSTKEWIKRMRVVQILFRTLELIGAVGILVLFILISGVDPLTAWVMRITVRDTGTGFFGLSRARLTRASTFRPVWPASTAPTVSSTTAGAPAAAAQPARRATRA